MQITPRDIKEMQFNMKIRGFDPEEVKNFLDMVSSEFEKVIMENNDLKNKVKRLENELEEYRNKDEKLDKILVTAQNFAENEKERIEKEIEMKYKEADLNIKEMMQDAENRKAELESEIESALDAHKDLPKTQKTVARIADALLWAETNGFEDVSVEDVLPSVKQEIRSEFNQLMDAMGEDAMEAYIGKRNLDRLRQKRLSKAKTNNIKNIEPTVKEKQVSDKEKKRLRAKDYFKNL